MYLSKDQPTPVGISEHQRVIPASLQTWVNVPGAPTLGDVARYVDELAFFPTRQASVRRSRCSNKEPALGALPVREAAFGADIAHKFS